ncbi:hypothetical protein Lalb_Chr13g0302731 [Lupinus albus]|uniref:Uncharacterized protein n=1 Tax=Lupinus albus TaxID=3870 RepID=A0A6A4PK48_LUPAL|nr:hypothetical protein Lalb_Chr13g0302731 [Lupinus albus]
MLQQLEETNNSQVPAPLSLLEARGPNIHYTRFPPHSEGFFHPLGVNPNLQIGYSQTGTDDDVNVGASSLNMHGFVSGWML